MLSLSPPPSVVEVSFQLWFLRSGQFSYNFSWWSLKHLWAKHRHLLVLSLWHYPNAEDVKLMTSSMFSVFDVRWNHRLQSLLFPLQSFSWITEKHNTLHLSTQWINIYRRYSKFNHENFVSIGHLDWWVRLHDLTRSKIKAQVASQQSWKERWIA